MVYHWSLSDSKSHQVSWTLLSILTNLNNVVVWMVSICLGFIIIIIYSLKFFTSALVSGFSRELEWQQVSSSLQDSSQYFGRFNNAVIWMISTRSVIIIIIIIIVYSLSDSKSTQVSRTLLSILTDLNNAAVWMVFIHLLIS